MSTERTGAERSYDNTTRAAAARETRRRILDAAKELLLDGGYYDMSIAELAARARVSPQTVYNSVGGKAKVVKAVYDTTLAGDDEPIAMRFRPEWLAMTKTPDRESFVRGYAAFTGVVFERVGRLLGVLTAEGSGTDAGLREFVSAIDEERRNGNTFATQAMAEVHGLPDGFDVDGWIDEMWVLTAPEVYDRLVRRCGWAHAAYVEWVGTTLVEAFRRRGGS